MVIHIGSSEILTGSFIASVVNFLIAAFIIFSMVKLINGIHERAAMRKKDRQLEEKNKEHKPSKEELLAQIPEEIKKRDK